jgi:S1-C subfamily serine protease
VDQARLGNVVPNGPADKAGVKLGDVVVKFAGKDIHTFRDLTAEVRLHKPGETLEMEVQRGDTIKKFSVTLEKK